MTGTGKRLLVEPLGLPTFGVRRGRGSRRARPLQYPDGPSRPRETPFPPRSRLHLHRTDGVSRGGEATPRRVVGMGDQAGRERDTISARVLLIRYI